MFNWAIPTPYFLVSLLLKGSLKSGRDWARTHLVELLVRSCLLRCPVEVQWNLDDEIRHGHQRFSNTNYNIELHVMRHERFCAADEEGVNIA